MGDGWKQDECRRGLTFYDDVYQTLDPLSRKPFTQLYLVTKNEVNGWERWHGSVIIVVLAVRGDTMGCAW